MEDRRRAEERRHREVIDVHTHCFTGRHLTAEVLRKAAELRAEGVRHLATIAVVNPDLPMEDAWGIVAGVPEHRGDPALREAEDLFAIAAAAAAEGTELIPFNDTRVIAGEVSEYLTRRLAEGFRGLKGMYLPDTENDIGAVAVPQVFGLSLEEYRRREWAIFAFAERHDLPVIYHVDARRHRAVIEAMLADFPRVRFDFAHFGIGRRALAPLLERHENAFTDFSSILDHMRGNRDGYRDFIVEHQDRVCFGSDAFLYSLEKVVEYVRLVEELGLPEEVEEKVFSTNPRRFLGPALADRGA
ncbi:MAG: amidohydrolase family protein [Deltaproteobacteria bacterium]|nr:amidohydrolase family protein [Deltaproteobacteria bacterium]